ncbi:MAG: DUF1573 domain-containing protein [Candidatus Harrisonbacteria bacterium]|nr:DUF1573 domain-containing protein [Candidatus Harrisonbacteria bacterium]
MQHYKEVIIITLVTFLVFGGIIWLASSDSSSKNLQTASVSSVSENKLVADESNFDFGDISMADGKVSKVFTLKNRSENPLTINKIYTSCMCTTATLMLKDGKARGPFGMPGHGVVPRINQVISGDEEVRIEATFDPAAHGPAGVGPIQRSVYVETDSGEVELGFTAVVRP